MAEVEEEHVEEVPEVAENASEPVAETTEKVTEIPLSEPDATTDTIKPKAKARGQRGKDKQPRAKQKAKGKTVREAIIEYETEESEPSADEAALEEIRALSLIRGIATYHAHKRSQKEALYASWFGR